MTDWHPLITTLPRREKVEMKRREFLGLCLLAGVSGSPVLAEPAPAWQVRADQSALGFVVAIGGERTRGTFREWSADIRFDPERPGAAVVDVLVEMGSVTIDSAQAVPLIGSATWLATAAHPTAVFTGRGIELGPAGVAEVPGTLTLRGVARPVRLEGTLTIKGAVATARLTARLARSAFGIGEANPMVSDVVTLTATVVADRA